MEQSEDHFPILISIEIVIEVGQIVHEGAKVNAEYPNPTTWSITTETTRNEKPDY